ncbi:hypothetical protein, partial [Stenotrophomonas pictorum]|uniref:hypothetical protein n=1 Tax=Stenotrophomonas pictorum TaxID=86184 RepID=UPI0012FE49E5
PGANEQALAAGPVRYTASQGTQRSIAGAPMVFPSLREPGDAYLIPDAYGEPLEEAAPAGPPALFGTTGSTPAVVGNGLDFCAALHRNSLSQGDASAANTVDAAGARYNIAYGLTAAGTQPGRHGRFDSADSIALPSPAQPGDADYDDRVRVRTFESMAHSLAAASLPIPPRPTRPRRVLESWPWMPWPARWRSIPPLASCRKTTSAMVSWV